MIIINCVVLFIIVRMLKIIHWPFKSVGNFAIASIGIVGVSFWGYSIYSEGKFNQPIIGETIKLLGRNPQVKELAGIAFSYLRLSAFIQLLPKQ